jgi:teichuronic acid biosynthesis glycosyltransferase TuaG
VMSQPSFSVVIPTYNDAGFLRAAVDSVQAQSFRNWEAIIVNNFSEDDTVSLIRSYGDRRIRLVNFANNGIIGAARNYGVSLATAPFVAFLDSDDVWYPNKLQRCWEKLVEGYDLVCHSEVWAYPQSMARAVNYGPVYLATYENLLFEGNCISTSAVTVRRERLERVGGFSTQPEFVTAEDYDLWLKLARDGTKIAFLDELLGDYRIHHESQSRIGVRNFNAVLSVFQHHIATLTPPPPGKRVRRREAFIFYSGARQLQNSGRFVAAWPYFFQSVIRFPLEPRFYASMLLNALCLSPDIFIRFRLNGRGANESQRKIIGRF